MTETLQRYLDDIENRLNPEAEDTILQGWKDWAEYRIGSDALPASRPAAPSKLEWPRININERSFFIRFLLRFDLCHDYTQQRATHASAQEQTAQIRNEQRTIDPAIGTWEEKSSTTSTLGVWMLTGYE